MPRLLFLTNIVVAGLLATAARAGEGESKGEGKAAEPPKPVVATGHYVQHWLPMPTFSAARLGGDSSQELVEPSKGRLLAVVFIASWCEPCQQLMPELRRLEHRYRKLPVDVVYVFAHDTRDDALGFMKEFNLDRAYLANQDVLKTYHSPELPSIYLGDRHGWLLKRWLLTKPADLSEMDELLKNLAAY